MRLAIVGSRTFKDYKLMEEKIKENFSEISEIVSGGALGADSLGAMYAEKNNIPLVEFLPQWSVYGKSAGFIRNAEIVNNSDAVIAFWDGKSPGTKHTIDLTEKANKSIIIVRYKES